MTGLQYRMLELVLEIDEICRKHNIIYYLAGGSILGAVRHIGFIPWDDDIDIMMTRQEFEKFQKACETDMREDREIISMMNTPCHTKVTIKYMNKSTSQFFRSQVLDTTGCGISLDIMILDPLPRDEKAKEQHIAEYIVYNELLTPFFMVNPYFYKHVPMYKKLHRKAKLVGKEKVMAELYQHIFANEPAESDQYLYRWGQQLLIYDRSLFGEPRYMDFEGHMLPVPEKTIDFLRATYGDGWIYLPPERQRETHVSNVNVNIAYCNWLKDIDPFLNRPKTLKDFVIRKKYNVEKAIPAHTSETNRYKRLAIMKQFEFQYGACYQAEALATLDDGELLLRVKDYLNLQLSGGFFKNQIVIKVPDKTLALILGAMVRVGDCAKADKILKLRRLGSAELPEELCEIQQLINSVRKMLYYFEDRRLAADEVPDIREVAPELLRLLKENPKQINFQRCALELYTLVDDYTEEEICATIKQAQECYPEDLEIAFWVGCLYEKMGREDDADELFEKALETSHGYVLLKLKEKGFSRISTEEEV